MTRDLVLPNLPSTYSYMARVLCSRPHNRNKNGARSDAVTQFTDVQKLCHRSSQGAVGTLKHPRFIDHAATNYTCAERARRAYNARISGHMTWRQDA